MKNWVLVLFVASCLLATLICIGSALNQYFSYNDSSYFVYEKLSSKIGFQPPYFGMFIAMAILISLSYLWNKIDAVGTLTKSLLWGIVIYLFCFIVLLSARTATVFLILYILAYCTFYFYRSRKLVFGLFISLSIMALAFWVISQSTYLKDRIMLPLTSDMSVIDGGKETGLSIRLVKWKCSLLGILENPMIGVGTGDAVDYLVKCYENENFWGMYPEYRYNSHNQYLETTLTVGLIGLASLLLCVLLPFASAWKESDHLFMGFIGLFCFCCLTESVLERQWGIVFFAFFTSILAFSALED